MDGLLTEGSKLLFQQGLVGVLLVIAGIALWLLFRELKTVQEKRLEEAMKLADSREDMVRALSANTLALEANNKAIDARTRAMDELVRIVAELKLQTDNNDTRSHEKLNDLIRKLEDCVRASGGRP